MKTRYWMPSQGWWSREYMRKHDPVAYFPCDTFCLSILLVFVFALSGYYWRRIPKTQARLLSWVALLGCWVPNDFSFLTLFLFWNKSCSLSLNVPVKFVIKNCPGSIPKFSVQVWCDWSAWHTLDNSAFGRSTSNDVSGRYKQHSFLFLFFSFFVFVVYFSHRRSAQIKERKLAGTHWPF